MGLTDCIPVQGKGCVICTMWIFHITSGLESEESLWYTSIAVFRALQPHITCQVLQWILHFCVSHEWVLYLIAVTRPRVPNAGCSVSCVAWLRHMVCNYSTMSIKIPSSSDRSNLIKLWLSALWFTSAAAFVLIFLIILGLNHKPLNRFELSESN